MRWQCPSCVGTAPKRQKRLQARESARRVGGGVGYGGVDIMGGGGRYACSGGRMQKMETMENGLCHADSDTNGFGFEHCTSCHTNKFDQGSKSIKTKSNPNRKTKSIPKTNHQE